MGAPEVIEGMESPSAVEIPEAVVVQNGENAHGTPEPSAPVEATKVPIEQNGVTARGAELPAISVEAPKATIEQNGVEHPAISVEALDVAVERDVEKSQDPIESLAPVEVPNIPVENGAVHVEAPKATGEPNGKVMEVASELPESVEISKAVGKENGEKAGGSAEALANGEAPTTVVKENGHEAGGGAETLANVVAPKAPVDSDVEKCGDISPRLFSSVVAQVAPIEESSGAEEVDNMEKNNNDENCSSLPSSGGTDGGWEKAENPSVLGPGPSESEKSVQPAPATQLYTFYMIRIPKFYDSKVKTEIRMAELRLKEMSEKRDFINAALQMRRASRTEALHKLRTAREKVRACSDAMRQKKEEINPLQVALRRIRNTGRQARDKSRDLPASEQELDEKIAYCEYRIQHESIPLKEEKQLLRDIKSLKASREAVCAHEALQAEFSESLGEHDDIQERLKPLVSELESLKTEWTAANETCKAAEAEFEEIDTAFSQVQGEWASANQARQDAYSELSTLSRHDNAQSNDFYQNRREIQHVRQLAHKKERKAVEEFCHAQVERVMALWNGKPGYRETYVKSNENSTLRRLQTFDGRALGPDEEPPLICGDGDGSSPEIQTAVGSLVSPGKSQREGPAASDKFVPQTAESQRKGKNLKSSVVLEPNRHLPSSNAAAGVEVVSIGQEEKGEEDSTAAAGMEALLNGQEKKREEDSAAAEAKLKQKRREEEMAKARSAEERKRKSAERSQSKAAAKARKEAERQEKEKEKRSQKKAARLTNSGERTPQATERGREAAPEAERGLDPVQEPAPKSGSISRQKKRPPSYISKTMKTPLESSLIKKNGIRPLTWFWGGGLVVLVTILASLAVFVYNS